MVFGQAYGAPKWGTAVVHSRFWEGGGWSWFWSCWQWVLKDDVLAFMEQVQMSQVGVDNDHAASFVFCRWRYYGVTYQGLGVLKPRPPWLCDEQGLVQPLTARQFVCAKCTSPHLDCRRCAVQVNTGGA